MKTRFIRLIKKNLIMAMVFVIISIFSFQVVTPIVNITIANMEKNKIFTTKVKNFYIEKKNINSFEKDVTKTLMDMDSIIIRNNLTSINDELEVYGVYFDKELEKKYKMKEGRFFQKEDFIKKENYAVVGETVYSQLDSKDTIVYKGLNFKIIGVLDSSASKGVMDNTVFVSLPYFVDNSSLDGIELSYSIDSVNGDVEKNVQIALNNKFKDYGEVSYQVFSDFENRSVLIKSLDTYKFFIILLVIVIIILIISVINITSLWIEDNKIELGVRKLLGGTNKKIILNLFYQYESNGIISVFIGFFIVKIMNIYNFIPIELTEVNIVQDYVSLLIVIFLVVIIGIIVAIDSSIKIMTLDINTIIKG